MCLTLPNNIGRIERDLSSFSIFRLFFVEKIHKMSEFRVKNDRKIEKVSPTRLIRPILLGSVKHT